ncbi:hypothetical protein Tcan_07461 [Toxocara canis]|uniref:Uncharacterized protein n=1 Tax=Toxocara canis TaxID=6265 RepID=A0A0B2VUI0_TOXCA|nr:hypothetical protein Tcan_07461 [Toxocara canis]
MYPSTYVDYCSHPEQRQLSVSCSWPAFLFAIVILIIIFLLSNCFIFYLASESWRLESTESMPLEATTNMVTSNSRMTENRSPFRVPTRAQGTIIESPVRTYTIPHVLTSGTEQSHATLNNLYPFKHVPPVNVRLWNEEDRKRVIFDPDVTDTFESFNLESTIEEVMNASTQSDEVTEVGRTRLFVQTPKPLDERLTNHNVAIQSVTTDYWPANGMFELKNFIFYPFKTSSTIQNPLRNST